MAHFVRRSVPRPLQTARFLLLRNASTEPPKLQPKQQSEYWGLDSATRWPWNCFKPSETYVRNVQIDEHKHHQPSNLSDRVAHRTVKILRWPIDTFYQKDYYQRVMFLETIAAVPGMVGGMLLHLRSLRKFEHSGGWIKALLEEAENERMHLMTLLELKKPKWYERLAVLLIQGAFFNAYFVLYVISPRIAHRVVGYLEEEAVYSYTVMIKAIDEGVLPNAPAPSIAIDYWCLSKDATMRDTILAIRADEAHHRDVNHFASDIQQHKTLKEAHENLREAHVPDSN